MEYFSYSKINTFDQCRLKYKFRYIDKIKPEIEKSIESHLGSSVHAALEWLYKKVKNREKIPNIDEVIINYKEFWESNYNEKIKIVKDGYTEKDYFNKGLKFLIDYYMENHPFDENTLEIEKDITIDLDEKGEYKIRGFIDRLVYNIEKGVYEIHDYKTSGSMPTIEKIENDKQLALYSIAIKEKFGEDKEIKLIWHYLSFNKKITSERTNEQLKKLKEETLQKVKDISSTTEFPPNSSILCDWCEYRSICPIFVDKVDEQSSKTDDFSMEDSSIKSSLIKSESEIEEDIEKELE